MHARTLRLLFAIGGVIQLVSCAERIPPAQKVSSPVAHVPAESRVDQLLHQAWAKAGIETAPRSTDAHFLRRVYLDTIGTLPTEMDAREFLLSQSPTKRQDLVERLLASPDYAKHWAVYWDDVLMGQRTKPQIVDRHAFVGFLHEEFKRNQAWNELAYRIVSAEGQNTDGTTRPRDNMAPWVGVETAPSKDVNGAVNWYLRFDNPQDAAGSASRAFLGVQIQCAQCHDHKTESWKQRDFNQLAACFARSRIQPITDMGMGMGGMKRVRIDEVPRVVPRVRGDKEMRDVTNATPKALDGTSFEHERNVRKALAAWITATENPWFARAVVNRMWGHYLGRGFVDPVDDLRPSNTPEAPELFDAITQDFVEHKFDLKHLLRTIILSDAYQRAASPAQNDQLWSHFRTAPLGPYELVHSIARASDLEATLESQNVDLSSVYLAVASYYSFLFDVDEEFDKEQFEGSISQSLALLNGSLTGVASTALPSSALEAALEHKSERERIESLYLRTLSRFPTLPETNFWIAYIERPQPTTRPMKGGQGKALPKPSRPDPLLRIEVRSQRKPADATTRAYEDLLWTLLNSTEFGLNH